MGKQILQEMCRNQLDWDSPLPDKLITQWEKWRIDLQHLKDLEIARCFKPKDFGDVVTTELHHFSDASTKGYGQRSYVRLVDEKETVHCTLVMAKSRVAPLKPLTLPRLELTAAVVSVRMSLILQSELEYANLTEWFWTDSSVGLGYIANDTGRFHVFVANRIQQIRDVSKPFQWNYVSSSNNPADVASRGASATELVKKSNWFSGPDFLWMKNPLENCNVINHDIPDDDTEIKRCRILETQTTLYEVSVLEYLSRFSKWNYLKRVVAWCRRCIRNTRKNAKTVTCNSAVGKDFNLTVDELQQAEHVVIGLLCTEGSF